jgi:nucleoside-diphosphate-sugar epimerase
MANVEDADTLVGLQPHAPIINLAAEHKDNVQPQSKYYDVNVIGARNVCKVAEEKNVQQIIFTSSVAVYGFSTDNTDESGDINFINEYGRTKYLAEEVYREWQQADPEARSLVIVRPTVIFGPGNRGNVYNLLKQVASKRFVMFGKGENIKSMAYVENVADFLVHCTSFGPGIHLYNYVDKPDMTVYELVSCARKVLFGRNDVGISLPKVVGVGIGMVFDIFSYVTSIQLPVSSIRVKKFLASTRFDCSVSEAGFTARHSLQDGLEATLKSEFLGAE